MAIQMPKVVKVQCDSCGAVDTANWSQYGAEQSCLVCDAAPIYLSQVGA